MEPIKPALHVQPCGTDGPVLFPGHGTGEHVLLKYGAVWVATTVPEYPGLHVQPAPTLAPMLLTGHVVV